MSNEDQAQKHLTDGLKLAYADRFEEAISHYEEALNLGLPIKDEVVCRAFLGDAYGQTEKALKHIEQFEAAILLDSKENVGFFTDKMQRDTIFGTIQLSYILESRRIREEQDIDAAISYLSTKLDKVICVPGIQMPLIHFELGNLYRENDQKDLAISSLKRAIEAESPADPEHYYLETIDFAKSNLSLLEEEQQQSGCFIATAVYGSSTADEVRILRTFRDYCMLPYSIGRYVIDIYYRFSPKLARFLRNHELAKFIAKIFILIPSILLVRLYFSMKRS